MEYLMECGHTAMAKDDNGNPICPICMCTKVVNERPNLEGRIAKCNYCTHEEKSDFSLPFFEYRAEKKYDSYYCGCFGWD